MTNYKLILSFLDGDDKAISFSYNHSKSSIDTEDVAALMNAMVTNGAIFKKVPVSKKGAKIVKTEETIIDVSGE